MSELTYTAEFTEEEIRLIEGLLFREYQRLTKPGMLLGLSPKGVEIRLQEIRDIKSKLRKAMEG